MKDAICFIGHRKVKETRELVSKIRLTILELMENEGVQFFLFGSKSEFDDLCYRIVSELRLCYPQIIRVAYTCEGEKPIVRKSKGAYDYPTPSNYLEGYDAEYEYKSKYKAGKARYVERNQAMIDDCDNCIFYYDEDYLPERRKKSKNDEVGYQPKSGTKLAYDYAVKKRKNIINVFEKQSDEKGK